jgi:hypothetical protein
MSKTNQNQANAINTEMEVEVLYQKLGDRWFAFSIVNDEVFMSPVSDDQIQQARVGQNPTEVSAEDFDFADAEEQRQRSDRNPRNV